jgi:hypothetical protein
MWEGDALAEFNMIIIVSKSGGLNPDWLSHININRRIIYTTKQNIGFEHQRSTRKVLNSVLCHGNNCV